MTGFWLAGRGDSLLFRMAMALDWWLVAAAYGLMTARTRQPMFLAPDHDPTLLWAAGGHLILALAYGTVAWYWGIGKWLSPCISPPSPGCGRAWADGG